MMHKIEQLDSGHWRIDGYEIRKEWQDWGDHQGEFYVLYDNTNTPVDSVYTTFEDALSNLLYYIECGGKW